MRPSVPSHCLLSQGSEVLHMCLPPKMKSLLNCSCEDFQAQAFPLYASLPGPSCWHILRVLVFSISVFCRLVCVLRFFFRTRLRQFWNSIRVPS
jgi:hypothetical protein